MGDVDFEVLIRVGFASITVKGFPLGRKRGVGDEVGEGVATSGLVGWEWMGGMEWWTRVGKVEVKL